MDELTSVVARLAAPAPPPTITATVMARIARDADCQRATGADATQSVRHRRDRPAWLWTVVGVAVVLGVRVYAFLSAGSLPSLTASRIGLGSLPAMPGAGPVSLIVGLGLLVYLGGLFAPLRRRKT